MAAKSKKPAKGTGRKAGSKPDGDAAMKRESRVEKKATAKKASAAAPAAKAETKRPVKKAEVKTKPAKAAARTAAKTAPPKVKVSKSRARAAAKPIDTSDGQRHNVGPERGDNSFPPSNKGNKGFSAGDTSGPAADSSSGPGGVTKQGGNRGERGSGKGKASTS